MFKYSFFLISAVLLLFTSCEKDKKALVLPSSYISENYDPNTQQQKTYISQFAALTKYLKKAEGGQKLSLDTITNLFTPIASGALATPVQDYKNRMFPIMVAASANTYDPRLGNANQGGVFGGRLLDKGGKETLQEYEKSMFVTSFYNQILNQLQTVDAVSIDKMIALYGASPAFPNTNTSAKTPTPDALIALYAARRDMADNSGLYTKTRDQFITLQAAVAAGKEYDKEKNQSVVKIKENMEKAILATVVHYGYTALAKLSKTNPTDTDLSGGLHDLSEAVGFTLGWRFIPQVERKITDAQIDQMLSLLNAPYNQDATMFEFITKGSTELINITQFQSLIKGIYQFSDTDMEGFKNNWIAVQGR